MARIALAITALFLLSGCRFDAHLSFEVDVAPAAVPAAEPPEDAP